MKTKTILIITGIAVVAGAGTYYWWYRKKHLQDQAPGQVPDQPAAETTPGTSPAPATGTTTTATPPPAPYVPPKAPGSTLNGALPIDVINSIPRDLFCHPPVKSLTAQINYKAQLANDAFLKSGLDMEFGNFLLATMNQMNCNG